MSRNPFLQLCLILSMLLGAVSFVQASPAQGDGSVVPAYGAEANPTGNPIGGGVGYTDVISSGMANYFVSTKSELLNALASATSGQIVYIADSAQIDMTGSKGVAIRSGVILASGRGRDGSSGGLICTNDSSSYGYPQFMILGPRVRVTGLRLRGPDGEISSSSSFLYTGLCDNNVDNKDIEIDNCEIYNWPESGVLVTCTPNSGNAPWIHHNYIHNCRRDGFGYGVAVAGGSALIEANLFDYNRHSVMGGRGYPMSSYEARYNIIGSNSSNSCVDCHGGNDSYSWGNSDSPSANCPAGGALLIHHNTFKSTSDISVGIRGVPANYCKVYNNWTYWPSSSSAETFKQFLENLVGYTVDGEAIRGTEYVRMDVYDNWYGTTPPPGIPVNSAPATPPSPSGTTPPLGVPVDSAPATPSSPSVATGGQTRSAYTNQAVTTKAETTADPLSEAVTGPERAAPTARISPTAEAADSLLPVAEGPSSMGSRIESCIVDLTWRLLIFCIVAAAALVLVGAVVKRTAPDWLMEKVEATLLSWSTPD